MSDDAQKPQSGQGGGTAGRRTAERQPEEVGTPDRHQNELISQGEAVGQTGPAALVLTSVGLSQTEVRSIPSGEP